MKFGKRLLPLSVVGMWIAIGILSCPNAGAADRVQRYIVKMSTDSLVRAANLDEDAFSRHLDGRLDLKSKAALDYQVVIEAEHAEFQRALAETQSEARVDYEYWVLFNGFVVANVDPLKVADLPGVSIVRPTDAVFYEYFVDRVVGLVGAPMLWEGLGGVNVAGEEMRIAIVDTGIDAKNTFFNPDSFQMPEGFPKGVDVPYTNAKVIAARAYFRPDDMPDEVLDSATPMDYIGHGSHCAGIAAGNFGSAFNIHGTEFSVSGIAPRAHLMNYKVFYTAESGASGAAEPELIAAFEDAVIDGAHVILGAFGAPDLLGPAAPSAEVYRSALDAGVVVVFAAGNGGPGISTVSYPASLRRMISVGATLTGRGFAGWVDMISPLPVPENLNRIPVSKAAIGPDVLAPLGPISLVLAEQAGNGFVNDGCLPFPANAFNMAAALIPGGSCTYSLKAENAYSAGAQAVIITNTSQAGQTIEMAGAPVDIPVYWVEYEDGQQLSAWVRDNPGAMVTINNVLWPYLREGETNSLWASSSRGTTDALSIKPEIVAPGAGQILSADRPLESWGLRQGTSMSAAVVAGAALLVRQQHPSWDQNLVKSAIIGSASPNSISGEPSPLGIGAGLLDLAATSNVELAAIPALLSMGRGKPGDTFLETVFLADLGGSVGVVMVSLEARLGRAPRLVAPPDAAVVPGQEFEVNFATEADFPVGDYAGHVLVDGTRAAVPLRIPYHFRLVNEKNRDLLIMDMSFLTEEQTALSDMAGNMAASAGLSWDLFRTTDPGELPSITTMTRYRAVLVLTGDNQSDYRSAFGTQVLDLLASYTRQGGRLVVAGQGAWRHVDHLRMEQIIGIDTVKSAPLIAKDTLQLLELDTYLVHPVGPAMLIDRPLNVGPDGNGQGDLGLVAELEGIRGAEMPEILSEPFLRMEEGSFQGDGAVGMLFDSYGGYGIYTEAEALKYRAVFMGFGFERIDDNSPDTASRQDLFKAVYDWVTDSLEIDVTAETYGTTVAVTVSTVTGKADVYEYSFGDSKDPITTPMSTFEYQYGTPGSKEITVLARSRLGAVAIRRVNVDVVPLGDASTEDDSDSYTPSNSYPIRERDCACSAVGTASSGMPISIVTALLLMI